MKIFETIVPSYFELENGLEVVILQDPQGTCLTIKINFYE
tara:strand:+ start:504 stop:623 length:120 start_codon:yes stop_codon:yes gene_type:complete